MLRALVGSTRALVLAVVAGYAGLTLVPFNWTAPRVVVNGAVRSPEGTIAFRAPGIARSAEPPGWVPASIAANRFDLRLSVRALLERQTGPARIFGVSSDPLRSNLTVAQDGQDLIVRLRTAWSDSSGHPPVRAPRVFASSGWHDIHIEVQPGTIRVRADSIVVRGRIPDAPLATWDPEYRVALGNEHTFDRPWLGEIARAVVRVADDSVSYAGPNAPVLTPDRMWIFHRPPKLVPFRDADLTDAILNVFFFVPLGVVLGRGRASSRVRAAGLLVLFACAVSLTLECLQLFVPARQPSVDDLITNTMGGALGVLLARRASAGRTDR